MAQGSAAVVAAEKSETSTSPVESDHPASRTGWLAGPWFDLFLIANLGWPLAVLIQMEPGFGGQSGLQFWQVYYVTTPHRWITLALVFLDRDRLGQRKATFVGIAAVVILICLGVRLGTGGLTCLLAIDYLWNAWHFASQHHGIYRIYRRGESRESVINGQLERWGLRLFLLYVIFRVASYTWAGERAASLFSQADWLILAVPACLLLRELQPGREKVWGGSLYLLSTCGLYVSLLLAVHWQRPALILSLTTASALFHAIEYLSVVGWATNARHATQGNRMGLMSYLVPRWGLALGMFILILGMGGWLMDQHLLEIWLLINVMVAFLHYAYDGLIWKGRSANRPKLAKGGTH